MSDQPPDGAVPPRTRSRAKDFWQLHVPLVLVLLFCGLMTVIEVGRAAEGVWRAWAYMIEWPLIGAFSVWIWHRYRTKGSLSTALGERWRARMEMLNRDGEPEAPDGGPGPAPATPPDPELEAWEDYQRRLGGSAD